MFRPYSKDQSLGKRKGDKYSGKSTSSIIRQTQKNVNKYVRLRDAGKPCISCGNYRTLEAGHYIAVGYCQKLRFNLKNIHGQCKSCNQYKSGNSVYYRINLINRIGLAQVEKLETESLMHKRESVKWDRQLVINTNNNVLEMIKKMT